MIDELKFKKNMTILGVTITENKDSLTFSFPKGKGVIVATKNGVSMRDDQHGNIYFFPTELFLKAVFDSYYKEFIELDGKDNSSTFKCSIYIEERKTILLFNLNPVKKDEFESLNQKWDNYNYHSFTLSLMMHYIVSFINQGKKPLMI